MSDDVHELGDLSDLEDGQMRCFEDVGDYGVVVCRVKGQLFAVEDNCSHADTPLSTGRLRGHNLACPLHGASFDVRDGSHSGPPAWTGVQVFDVSEGETGVVITPHVDANGDNAASDVGGRFETR